MARSVLFAVLLFAVLFAAADACWLRFLSAALCPPSRPKDHYDPYDRPRTWSPRTPSAPSAPTVTTRPPTRPPSTSFDWYGKQGCKCSTSSVSHTCQPANCASWNYANSAFCQQYSSGGWKYYPDNCGNWA